MLYTNNEIDRAYYFTILRTPWGKQMEDGLLSRSMGRIVDRTGMLEKLLKKSTQNNIRFVFYGGENSSIRNAMMLLNRDFDSCEWHEHLNEDEIICDDNIVYIVSADADDGRGLEKLTEAGLENGEGLFYNTEVPALYRGWICPIVIYLNFPHYIVESLRHLILKNKW